MSNLDQVFPGEVPDNLTLDNLLPLLRHIVAVSRAAPDVLAVVAVAPIIHDIVALAPDVILAAKTVPQYDDDLQLFLLTKHGE